MLHSFFNSRKYTSIIMGFLLTGSVALSQQSIPPAVESFESDQVLEHYKTSNSSLTISTDYRRFGESSLKWEWRGAGSFDTSNFRILSHSESPLKYGSHFPSSPTTALSLYNETLQNGTITISFGKKGNEAVWFTIPLNFKGWRRVWVPFYEMQGNTPEKGAAVDYDYFRISTSLEKGKLYLDDIIFSQYQDDRHQYPDLLVPFIK